MGLRNSLRRFCRQAFLSKEDFFRDAVLEKDVHTIENMLEAGSREEQKTLLTYHGTRGRMSTFDLAVHAGDPEIVLALLQTQLPKDLLISVNTITYASDSDPFMIEHLLTAIESPIHFKTIAKKAMELAIEIAPLNAHRQPYHAMGVLKVVSSRMNREQAQSFIEDIIDEQCVLPPKVQEAMTGLTDKSIPANSSSNTPADEAPTTQELVNDAIIKGIYRDHIARKMQMILDAIELSTSDNGFIDCDRQPDSDFLMMVVLRKAREKGVKQLRAPSIARPIEALEKLLAGGQEPQTSARGGIEYGV